MLYLQSSEVFELDDDLSPPTSDSKNYGGISEEYTPTRGGSSIRCSEKSSSINFLVDILASNFI